MTTIPERLAARLAKAQVEHDAVVRVLGKLPESSLRKKLDHAYRIPLYGSDVVLGVKAIREDVVEILKEFPPEDVFLRRGPLTGFFPGGHGALERHGMVQVAPFQMQVYPVETDTLYLRRTVDVRWFIRLEGELVRVQADLLHDPVTVSPRGNRRDGYIYKGVPAGELIAWGGTEPPAVTVYWNLGTPPEAILSTTESFFLH